MKYKWLPIFDISNCSGCRACMSYCPSGSLSLVNELITFTDPESCLSDEFCVRECPNEGVRMHWVSVPDHYTRGKVVNELPLIVGQ